MSPASSSRYPPSSAQRLRERTAIRRKRILWALLIILIVLPLSGALYQVIGAWLDQRNYPPPGQLVDVGGYRLHLYCMGENTPGQATVILETGLGGIGVASPAWAWVQPQVAKTARVCAYDRAGLGWSDPGPKPRDANRIAAELHTLLQNSHTPGPYVLVGWSYGGLYMRAFAGQYPAEVAGLVLLDSSFPGQCDSSPAFHANCASNARFSALAPFLARLGILRLIGHFQPASGLPDLQRRQLLAAYSSPQDWEAQNAEFQAASATDAQVLKTTTFGALPLMVLTATQHGASADLEQLWQGWQTGYTALSTNSLQWILPGTTHEALVFRSTDASVTAEAILEVLESARTGKPLKR